MFEVIVGERIDFGRLEFGNGGFLPIIIILLIMEEFI